MTSVRYAPAAPITGMVTANEQLVMAMANGRILRLHLANASEPDDIEVTRKEGDIHRLFLDPTGSHLVIALKSEETYYLHKSWKKPKVRPRLLSRLS